MNRAAALFIFLEQRPVPWLPKTPARNTAWQDEFEMSENANRTKMQEEHDARANAP